MNAINQTEAAVVAADEPWLLERGVRPAVVGALAIVCETVVCMEAIHSAVPDSWVAMAGNADKLMDCAMAVRKQYTDAKIVLAAVNDAHAEKFTGQRKKAAVAAAWAVGGYLAFPPIDPDFSDPVDWENLLQSGGVFAVSRCIEKAGKVEDEPGESEPQGFNDGYDPMDDGAGEIETWQTPEPLRTLPAVNQFTYSLLPEALRDWVQDIAERMQCPADFVAVGAVVGLASLIGAKVVMQPKQFDTAWQVTPNLWGMVIAPPGGKKSPAIGEALKHIDRLEAKEREAHAAKLADWESQSQAIELKQSAKVKEAKAKASKLDVAKLAELLKPENQESEPVQRRSIVNDATVEALTELLMTNPYGLLAYSDELSGLLEAMTKHGQEGARAFYLAAWNGNQSHTVDRVGRGLGRCIQQACVSMLGGIQPGKLKAIVQEATGGGAGSDGLLQRFQLAVWPDAAREYAHIDSPANKVAKEQARAVFDRLHALPEPITGNPPAWRFSEAAQLVYRAWDVEIQNRIRRGDLHQAMNGHLSKYAKLVPALALVFALIDDPQCSAYGEPGTVQEGHLFRALEWANYLESHAVRIYATATTPETDAAVVLLRRIRAGEVPGLEFTTRDIKRKGWGNLSTTEAVRDACKLLVDCGWLRCDVRKPGGKGGRPSEAWLVNPQAMDAGLKLVQAMA